jgi:hypothetical protein
MQIDRPIMRRGRSGLANLRRFDKIGFVHFGEGLRERPPVQIV